jgi:carbamate kinase
MRLVIAIGGNALLKRGEPLSSANQAHNMAMSAIGLAKICADHEVAIVHGNGPQVGLLALEAALYKEVPPYPFDVLGAESQGMIGYVIAQAMRNALPGREVAALLTQTLVDKSDPAFERPTKPIGPVYTAAEIGAVKPPSDWHFAADGSNLRRVVASPKPLVILELTAIKCLVNAGVLTICCGGGGIPVIDDMRTGSTAKTSGVEAVIDKDLASALLATKLGADRLIILTDVDGIYTDWAQPNQRLIRSITVAELQAMKFAEGSMGPKVEAACRFVGETGKPAFIGNLQAASLVMAGAAGTKIA